jgi:hypothetical protein
VAPTGRDFSQMREGAVVIDPGSLSPEKELCAGKIVLAPVYSGLFRFVPVCSGLFRFLGTTPGVNRSKPELAGG